MNAETKYVINDILRIITVLAFSCKHWRHGTFLTEIRRIRKVETMDSGECWRWCADRENECELSFHEWFNQLRQVVDQFF